MTIFVCEPKIVIIKSQAITSTPVIRNIPFLVGGLEKELPTFDLHFEVMVPCHRHFHCKFCNYNRERLWREQTAADVLADVVVAYRKVL